MCESRELTSNPPFGVTRLVEAPLVLVHAALDNQESINIIRSRLEYREYIQVDNEMRTLVLDHVNRYF